MNNLDIQHYNQGVEEVLEKDMCPSDEHKFLNENNASSEFNLKTIQIESNSVENLLKEED